LTCACRAWKTGVVDEGREREREREEREMRRGKSLH